MRRVICALLLALITTVSQAEEIPTDLWELTLEELMNIEVTSVSKKEEKLFEAAAAVYVVTGENIRRSGATSISEALRMVPGMEVARIDANKWAISSRGFNDLFSNKLLVLIDGRSVYSPMFSGVFWEAEDVLLEDVDRIEVIRGPGATLWGANAVNGVINIITKHAKDTQGGLVTSGVGTEERGFGVVRYGGKLGDDLYYRIYTKYFNRDNFVYASGAKAADGWDVLRGGFRMDWKVSSRDMLTLQGDIYNGDVGQTYRIIDSPEPPYKRTFDYEARIAGGNVLGRWEHGSPEASNMTVQLYSSQTKREEAVVKGIVNTFDLDVQHWFELGERQEIVWGLGYRFTSDETDGTFTVSFDPGSRNYQLISAFVQDEITFVEDRLRLTLGSKIEHNDFTGFEIQPNTRLLWIPHEHHTAWAAVSRAARTPSRADDDLRSVNQVLPPMFPGTPPTFVVLFGNRGFESEELLAFELGYRVRPTDQFLLDIATFYNVYDKLRTLEPDTTFLETSPSPPHYIVPSFMDNKMDGKTYGVELAADWWVLDWWRLRPIYAYLKMQLHPDEDSGDIWAEPIIKGQNPHHQFYLCSSMDLPGNLELDLGSRYADNLPSLGVESYLSLDVRLGWNPIENIGISVVGQNLLDRHHPEFMTPHIPTLPTEVERGVYGAITWKF